MVLDDSDDEKWVYREHTSAKHEVYRKYLNPWVNKLTSYNERANQYNKIRIVDCFAGRGSYVRTVDCEPQRLEEITTPANIPGSPQIILDKLTQRSSQFTEAECIFIEHNRENFENLEDNLAETTGVDSSININTIHGKFQETILELVETDGSDYPTLFFIDPFGFKSLDYDVVTEIGSTNQFEFLVTFMSRDINRFFENEDHLPALRNLFGEDDFHEKVGEYDAENWEPLVEYYTDRLEENGPEHTFEYLITEPDTRQTVYYLVFGTNKGHGLKVMREVMNTCGTGNFGYAPKHIEHDRSQEGLDAWMDTGTGTNQYLLNNYDNQRIEFGTLVDECVEVRKYSDDMESDYRSSIKELETRGEVEVIRITSKTDGTGVQRGDVIDFRETDQDTLS